MGKEILEEMVRQYLSLRFPISTFSWQGGEPTLMGLPFFEQVVGLQMKHGRDGQSVGNTIQTNGILLDDMWCKFFHKYKFFVGLSLDGPKEVHNRYRVDNEKRSSWDYVMRAVKLLRKYNIEFNILSVVTDRSQYKAKEIFKWFLENGFRYLQFIPCVELASENRKASFSVTPEGYGKFLCDLFDSWWEHRKDGISIRTFDTVLESLVYGKSAICIFSPKCQGYLLVEHDGTVYPCDFFVSGEQKIGDLRKDSLMDIYKSDSYKKFGIQKSILDDECKRCDWLSLCYGGCQKDRIGYSGEKLLKTYLCSAYKMFFSYSMNRFKALKQFLLKNHNPDIYRDTD